MLEIMLEVLPPQRRAPSDAIRQSAEKIKASVDALDAVRFLNVPEITEENYIGVPLYKHHDARDFGALLRDTTKCNVVVNKVTVYLKSEEEFSSWLSDSIDKHGIRYFVFVGGNSHTRKYPGPQVIRANEIASANGKVHVGNICIPTRVNEPARLLAKTRSGVSFFTTQLLFESGSFKKVVGEYAGLCEDEGLKPSSFFVSLAPVTSGVDMDFFKWLGALIPPDVESNFSKSGDMGAFSVKLASGIFYDINHFMLENGIKIKVSPNIEAISNANLGAACEIAKSILAKG